MERQRTVNGDLLPDADLLPKPGDPSIGVRRVNNLPLFIVGGVVVVFVVLVALVAVQRGGSKRAEAKTVSTAALPENSQLVDQMLASGAVAGLVPDPEENAVPSFPIARVEDLDIPPQPASAGAEPTRQQDNDEMAKERMKLFQTAMRARTGLLQSAPKKSETRDDGKNDPGNSGGAETGDRRGDSGNGGGATGPEGQDGALIVAGGDYARFDRKTTKGKNSDRWLLDSELEDPRTAYEVRAGSVIPATMISGINSELPGQIVAQVSQDVFDTPTGRYRLIPQGSKLIGRYNNNVVLGQSRVLVAWQRIVFPDGRAMDIGAMEGVDSAGYAGFNDKVNSHYLRMFGSAILMSGITAGLTSSRIDPSSDPFGSSNAATLSQALAQQVGEVAIKMIEKNMNVAPTLQIRPGYRFNVMAVKDLTFNKPYQAFEYQFR
ncbi:TrbI/VirB10 family protein [Luteibacter yeojuensis]|uniref:Conjugal transfer protein TrbI n=1 Tax=Luteibacter yeojuensis TaxID=345309 RepID=A0A7X5QVX7_9GAMM|nr:TrbI/VirB10 family protein [Luteibacter yeojuensis]NID16417.1 conjugal transfer protein TrbI [Luteibacter yeojuensis]